MSYLSQEQSVELGSPVELYLFENLEETFAYTTGPEQITLGPIDYLPRNISPTEPDITADLQPNNLSLRLPAVDAFALRYRALVPPSTDRLTVRSLHLTDGGSPEVITTWTGEVASVSFEGDEAIVVCEPLLAAVRRLIPRNSYSVVCRHVLYDAGCKVNENDLQFRFNVTVSAISGTLVTVDGTGIGALGADFFVAGFLDRGNLEFRMVLTQEILTPNQLRLGLLLPFSVLSESQILVLRAGCDHSSATCFAKFDNIENFGGFPWVPGVNPFTSGIE